jgi:hypothetical protein
VVSLVRFVELLVPPLKSVEGKSADEVVKMIERSLGCRGQACLLRPRSIRRKWIVAHSQGHVVSRALRRERGLVRVSGPLV